MRIFLNDEWYFTNDFNMNLLNKEYDISSLECVRLPHSFVETSFNYFDESIYQMIAGYRKTFKPQEEWKNKRVILNVMGAAHKSSVYINGIKVYVHECGYTAYSVDITEHLLFDDDNILVIGVDSNETLNQPPFGNVIDYMTYGGLYREVYLDIKNDSYINDVFTKTLSIENGVTFESVVEVVNKKDFDIYQELYDINKTLIKRFNLNELKHTLDVELWDINDPNLYYLKTILVDEDIIDERWDLIGFRKIDFKNDGFYLNDKKIKIRGLNRHQSYPYVGYAMPKSMQVEDAKILKCKLGLNAVRTSHYPQSHHFIEACDRLGLLVFTEIPGWQHIGNEEWKEKAVLATADMVKQYRNHPSIILWGVRINESMDDNNFYKRTNDVAHKLDDSRPTSGVRFIQKSSLLEDVYSYNDFSHEGSNSGCLPKKSVTSNISKPYLISEYNGHMFPTKSFDDEDHRVEHMKRHAKVLDAYYSHKDILGGFGWCMADYNTHKDFGSGDRICYHGVLDMFRNPKLASFVYSSFKNEPILEVSSMMDIGEHPACLSKDVYAITNADSIRLFKNDVFIKEFYNSPYKSLPHGPILIDDFVGDLIEKQEGFSHKKSEEIKKILLAANKYGLSNLPFKIKLLAAKCIIFRGMKMDDAVQLYYKYISNWGGTFTTYKFEAIKNGEVVKTVIRKPVTKVDLDIEVSHTELLESTTYDVAGIRIKAVDELGNTLPYYQEAIRLSVEGPIKIVGPSLISLKGGMGGTYVKTLKNTGEAKLIIECNDIKRVIEFNIRKE